MLFHSANMTGAAQDKPLIVALVAEMVPTLKRFIPLEALDAVYTRWLADHLADPKNMSVMVTAHGLLSTWHTIQAELAAQEAKRLEDAAAAYRAQVQAELRRNPIKTTHISDLAKRDGVVLPFGARSDGDGWVETKEQREEAAERHRQLVARQEFDQVEHMARVKRNEQIWHELGAVHEQRIAGNTERTKGHGKKQTTKAKQKGNKNVPDGE